MSSRDGFRAAISEVQEQMLLGLVPRHVLDVDMTKVSVDPRFGSINQYVIDRAFAISDSICSEFELTCHEFSSVEEDGLAGRTRYLSGIGVIAVVTARQRIPNRRDRFAYLTGVHSLIEARRAASTYDLSNALAALLFHKGRENPAEALGIWFWSHALTDDTGAHLRWLVSTMRFQQAMGRAILDGAAPVIAVVATRLAEALD